MYIYIHDITGRMMFDSNAVASTHGLTSCLWEFVEMLVGASHSANPPGFQIFMLLNLYKSEMIGNRYIYIFT